MTITTFAHYTRFFALILSFVNLGYLTGAVCATFNPVLILALVIIFLTNVFLLRWMAE